MSEFVGRTGSLRVYSYPEPRRTGDAAPLLARNYATADKSEAVGTGIPITWNSIDVGTDPSPDIDITPLSTGQLLVSGVITFQNPTGSPIAASITVDLDSGPFVPVIVATIPAGFVVAVPFLAETEIISPLNELHRIQVAVTGNGLTVGSNGAVVNVQEVPISTG